MIESNGPTTLVANVTTPPNVHVSIRRFFAFFLDGIFLGILQAIVSIGFGVNRYVGSMPTTLGSPTFNNQGLPAHAVTTTVDWPWLVLMAFLYFFLQEAAFGTTLGKAIMGLRVIDENGSRLTLQAALIRNVLLFLDAALSLLVAGISMAVSPNRQRVGDRFAHTLVVSAETAPLATYPRETIQRHIQLALVGFLLLVAVCFAGSYYLGPVRVIEGWKNTNEGFFSHKTVSWYSLGNPIWKDGTVTYPITYTVQQGRQHCTGSVTFRHTANILWPWTQESYQDSCPS